ncbi:MAG: hypothetical protein HFJ43_02315 [Clostridia bacterium]|nr:hypothetical protein [Clostridia bacterium]
MKAKFFSKLKDYNYILDQLLEKKNFEEDVKNLLLSMVYKVETFYKDYSKIKRNNLSKNDFIDNIIIKTIKEYCGDIYLIDPKNEEKDILEKQNVIAITNEVERKIYAYPTEIALLYGISDIKPKFFFIGNKYNYIKQPFQEMLVEGTNLNNTEVIRNFNGWSWNVEVDSKINNIYNCLYQTLSILFGHTFLDVWENDFSGKKDYISEMRKRMEEGYSKNISDGFYISFCNILILNARNSEKLKAKRMLEMLLKEYEEIKDKNKYILTIAKEKKVLEKQIKNTDDILKNKDLLLKEYNVRNLKLAKNKKIFNISELTEILEEEKKNKEKLMKRLLELEKPSIYNKNKKDIEEKIEILKPLKEENIDIYKYLVDMQKKFLKCVSKEIEAADKKEDYINLIYTIRYYRNIHLTQNKMIKEIPELNNTLNKIGCKLITIMCKKGIFRIFCRDIAMNYKIILQALNSSIVDIDDIDICLKLQDDDEISKLFIEIYDNDTIDSSLELDYQLDKKDLSVRQKKHVPLVNF